MLRDKNFYLRGLVTILLVGSLFGLAAISRVNAAPASQPVAQDLPTDTPLTPTFTKSPTLTETPTYTSTPSVTPTFTLTPTATHTLTITATYTTTSTHTITPTSTITTIHTVTPTSTITRTHTVTPTATITPGIINTPTAPNHLVISEFRTVGPLGANDEFVEIYNPTGAAVSISGWTILKSSSCGTSVQTLATITSGTILQPGQHYLLAASGSNSSITDADQTFSPGIANDGGLALYSTSGLTIDQVGMCATTYFREGTILSPLTGTSDQSYERKPGGETSCVDTTNNAGDFALISPASPLNHNSPEVMCAGVVLSTLTFTPTWTLTRTPTRAPTAIPQPVVLNEILPHPRSDWNGDGTANVGDEYVEIINVSTAAVNVANWKLDTGIGSPKTFTLPAITLQPRQIAFFFSSQTGLSISSGGSTVRLLKSSGAIADAYTYSAVDRADRTWCRQPDGSGKWGYICLPSPGRPNIFLDLGTPGVPAGNTSVCFLDNTASQSTILAECGSFDAGIAANPGEKLFWLQSRWKWDTFVE